MAHGLIPATSARLRARISGALYVLCIGCGFFAEMVVRAKLVVCSDAAVTAHNIAAAPRLYRAGFFADVSGMTLGVLSSVLLYTLLKAVSRGLALTVLVLDVISNAVSISGSVLLFAPLLILQGDGYLSVLTAPQLNSRALLSIKLYESVYAISLGLFSGSCLLTGYRIFRPHAKGFRGLSFPMDLPANSGRRRNSRAVAADRGRQLRQMGRHIPHADYLTLAIVA